MKLMTSHIKTITYLTEQYSVSSDPNITLEVNKENGVVRDCHFTRKEAYSDYGGVLGHGDGYKRFYLYKNQILKELSTKHFADIQFLEFLVPFDQFIDDDELDLNLVLQPYWTGHMVFRITDLRPVPTVLHFDYIDGIDNKNYYIDKALEHLRTHRFVLDVQKEKIPEYNAEADRTHGLKVKVLLSQAASDAIWDTAKDTKNPTVEYQNLFRSYGPDPLDVRQFLKPAHMQ